jgi:hypothetical protein
LREKQSEKFCSFTKPFFFFESGIINTNDITTTFDVVKYQRRNKREKIECLSENIVQIDDTGIQYSISEQMNVSELMNWVKILK